MLRSRRADLDGGVSACSTGIGTGTGTGVGTGIGTGTGTGVGVGTGTGTGTGTGAGVGGRPGLRTEWRSCLHHGEPLVSHYLSNAGFLQKWRMM